MHRIAFSAGERIDLIIETNGRLNQIIILSGYLHSLNNNRYALILQSALIGSVLS